jgi:hypothetical protein
MCLKTAFIGQRLGADWHRQLREATPEEHGVMRGGWKLETIRKALLFQGEPRPLN